MSEPSNRTDDEDSDQRLMERTAAGDRSAFSRLVARHQAAVFRFSRALTSSNAEAEDVLQQTFLAAYRNAGAFRGDSATRTWLFTIARNAAWHARQKLAREAPDDDPLSERGGADLDEHPGDPEALTSQAEEVEVVREAIRKLAHDDQEILILRDLEGLSGQEVCELLGIGLPAMKSRLHRARMRLLEVMRGDTASGGAHDDEH